MDELAEIDAIRQKEDRVLGLVLDKKIHQENRSLRSAATWNNIGRGRQVYFRSFLFLHALTRMGGSKEHSDGMKMDFLNNIDEKTNKLIIDEESAELLRQRAPDWSRQVDNSVFDTRDVPQIWNPTRRSKSFMGR